MQVSTRRRGAERELADQIVRLKRLRSDLVALDLAFPRGKLRRVEVESMDDSKQQPMLVDVAQLVDEPERHFVEVMTVFLDSLIRLYRVERVEDVFPAYSRLNRDEPSVALVSCSRVVDRELCTSTRIAAVKLNESVSEVIEPASKVEERVTDDGAPRPVVLGHIRDPIEEPVVTRVAVWLTNDALRCSLSDRVEDPLEIMYMRVRPRQLRSDSIKARRTHEDWDGRAASTSAATATAASAPIPARTCP